MRTTWILLSAALFAAPLSAQSSPAMAAGAWLRLPVPDARLRVEWTQPPTGGLPASSARSGVRWMLLGAAAGCVGGALLMGSAADDGEVAVQRFNGCVLGGSAGMFLGGVYTLVRGG